MRHRRASFLAGAAMLAALTSLFLPWWWYTNHTGGYSDSIGLWAPGPEDIRQVAVYTTAALMTAAVPLLFVRVAARSIVHEPRSFRRDVGIAALAMLLGLVACWAWPIEVPFWGTKTFVADPASGVIDQTVEGRPGAGWWVGLLAFLLASWSRWLARPEPAEVAGFATTEK